MPGLRDDRPTDLWDDADPLGVIPAPWRIERVPGSALVLGPGSHVRVDEDPGAVGVAVILARRLGELTGCPVAVTHEDDGHPGVVDLRLVTRLVDVASFMSM